MLTNKSCAPEEVTIATVVCFMFSIRIHMRNTPKHTLLVDYLQKTYIGTNASTNLLKSIEINPRFNNLVLQTVTLWTY